MQSFENLNVTMMAQGEIKKREGESGVPQRPPTNCRGRSPHHVFFDEYGPSLKLIPELTPLQN
jgi:hypothetical protein